MKNTTARERRRRFQNALNSNGYINLGLMDIECQYCHALQFEDDHFDHVVNKTLQFSPC